MDCVLKLTVLVKIDGASCFFLNQHYKTVL